MKKLFIFFALYFLPYLAFAQSAYMYEVAEDADNSNPAFGFLGVVLFILVGYFIIHINDLITKQKEIKQKEIRKRKWEEEKAKLEIEKRAKEKEQKNKEIQQRLKVHELWKTNNEIIDLGLSVNWASINIGANAISDYGYIYAWGMTTETPEYSFSKGLELPLTECANISGNKLYDPVAKWIDKGWRMPTKDEFEELIRFCQWDITTENGNLGYSITGPNGNKIFLPVNTFDSGSYWTANPYENDKDTEKYKSAYCMSFDLSPYQHLLEGLCQKEPTIKTFTRDSCNAIRPVSDKTKS